MYTVIGIPASRTFRVLWMLEELDLPYDHEALAPHSERVRALNTSGKVPVLLAEGSVLTDSTAILAFLADRHGALTFPAGTLDRARQDALTHRFLDEIEALVWTAARHGFILPPEQRMPGIKDSLRWELARNAGRLAADLGDGAGPYLMGDTFTFADIVATHCLDWTDRAKMPLSEPGLAAYGERVRARPAYRRVLAMMPPRG